MPTNLLLLPLLGGYCFLYLCHYYRYRSQRLDGYRLLIEAAIAGLALVTISRIVVCSLRGFELGGFVKDRWEAFSPFPYSGSAVGAVVLGLSLPFVVNIFWDERRSKDRTLKKHGNVLLQLLHSSVLLKDPIAVTLSNRKWYMGYVMTSPSLDPLELYFNLIPLRSGYRDSDTLELKRTVFYEEAYAADVSRSNFSISIPLASVTMAHFFDESVYQATFAPKDQSPEDADSPS